MQTFLENNTLYVDLKMYFFVDFSMILVLCGGHNMMSELELEFQKQRLKHSFFSCILHRFLGFDNSDWSCNIS